MRRKSSQKYLKPSYRAIAVQKLRFMRCIAAVYLKLFEMSRKCSRLKLHTSSVVHVFFFFLVFIHLINEPRWLLYDKYTENASETPAMLWLWKTQTQLALNLNFFMKYESFLLKWKTVIYHSINNQELSRIVFFCFWVFLQIYVQKSDRNGFVICIFRIK